MAELILLILLLAVALACGARLLFRRRPATDILLMEAAGDSEPDSLSGLRRQLAVLRLNMAPVMFVAGVAVVSTAVFLVFLTLFPASLLLASLAALSVMPLVFYLLKDLAAMGARRFEQRLVDAIELMQAALLGGEPPRQALLIAAEASRGRVRDELQELVRRLDLGLPVEQATARIGLLYDTEGVRLFIQAMTAKWQSGVDFGALVQAVSRVLRERIKQRMLLAGQLSGSRLACVFIALLPYGLIPVFLWKEPAWLDRLTSHPHGATLLLLAVLCQAAGFFWLRRLLRSEP